MTRPELEQRLIELERSIEQHRTGIWLAEHERLPLLNDLRRLIHAESIQITRTTPEKH
jgi:hypothetical protein